VFLDPDRRIVLASSGEAVPGGSVDWSPYGRFSLSNSADEIVLSFNSVEVDRLAWSSGWPLPTARSTALSDRAVDGDLNDAPASWCASSEPYGDGTNMGSPGELNGICPICGDSFVEPPEECDDGGTEPDDGCDPYCFFE
jgi:cysteine-rich repeat protein